MHYQVGIAPDGRGEVAVIGQRQPEVAQRLFAVTRLAHGAQRGGLYHRARRAVLAQLQQALEGARLGRRARAPGYAQPGHQLLQPHNALGVGLFVHAVNAAQSVFEHMRRHRLIGQQHELLYHALGRALRARYQLNGHAAFVQPELELRRIEVDGAARAAPAVQRVGQAAHVTKRRVQLLRNAAPVPVREQAVDIGISEARARMYYRGEYPVVAHGAVFDLHLAGERQPVLVRHQAAQPAREGLGQHMHRAPGQVDRGAAPTGLGIDGAARAHELSHVCDMHAQQHAPLLAAQRHRVVEVLGRVAVYRKAHLAAQIAAARVAQALRVQAVQHAQLRLVGLGPLRIQAVALLQRGLVQPKARVGALYAHQAALHYVTPHGPRVYAHAHHVALVQLALYAGQLAAEHAPHAAQRAEQVAHGALVARAVQRRILDIAHRRLQLQAAAAPGELLRRADEQRHRRLRLGHEHARRLPGEGYAARHVQRQLAAVGQPHVGPASRRNHHAALVDVALVYRAVVAAVGAVYAALVLQLVQRRSDLVRLDLQLAREPLLAARRALLFNAHVQLVRYVHENTSCRPAALRGIGALKTSPAAQAHPAPPSRRPVVHYSMPKRPRATLPASI